MRLRKELILLLLVMSAASEPEISKKRSDASDEEAEEDVSLEENAFEHMQELKALHDTILKIVPASDPYLNDKITKRKEEAESDPKAKDESPMMTNVLTHAMIARARNIDLPNGNLRIEDEYPESWSEGELLAVLNEEAQEPLTPEQQEGIQINVALSFMQNSTQFDSCRTD